MTHASRDPREPQDPRDRFTSRVGTYALYRPGYPQGLLDVLRGHTGLEADWVVADIGSGTGLSSLPFLDHGNRVVGVEPNAAMRLEAEVRLARYPGFASVAGSAEATGLTGSSVDLVVAGQAFHWFDQGAARAEFARILRPPGWVALVWNARRLAGDPFSEGYERLLEEFGTDYGSVRHDRMDPAEIAGFFHRPGLQTSIPNEQQLDLEGLRGRLLSSSYTPDEGDPMRAPMLRALEKLFRATREGGFVRMRYDTKVWVGEVHPAD